MSENKEVTAVLGFLHAWDSEGSSDAGSSTFGSRPFAGSGLTPSTLMGCRKELGQPTGPKPTSLLKWVFAPKDKLLPSGKRRKVDVSLL